MTDSNLVTAVPSAPRIQREMEARKARGRLYPVSLLYTVYSLTLLTLALRAGHPGMAIGFFGAGVFAWTLIEYLAHRYILHGRFPDGPGPIRHFLHEHFDHLHWEHHDRPWDGNHISGTIEDTLPFVLVFVGVSFLAPLHTLPVLIAGILQSYIAEEWVHHSVHFANFRHPYFRYIKRHHLYHHSPKGSEVGYGLTNGFWDVIYRTRIPERIRRALYGPDKYARAH